MGREIPTPQPARQQEVGSPPGVAEEEPLPLPYALSASGAKVPLPGVASIFLTGATVELVGLQELAADLLHARSALVSKDKLLKDLQFRGAISDFYPIKDRIQTANYDPLVIRSVVDDLYGDGSNFEIAVSKEAAEAWEHVEAEARRREQRAREAAAAGPQAAVAAAVVRTRHEWTPRPWQSLGSEAEMTECSVRTLRAPVTVTAERPRRAFNRPVTLGDKDSGELWNSSQMECRPFKDPKYDVRRMEADASVQAVPATTSTEAQATAGRPCHGCAQTAPLTLPEHARSALLASQSLDEFLLRVYPRTTDALQSNEVVDVFRDELAALAEDEAGTGGRRDNALTEYQSFTDLLHSKNKVVSAVQWLPHRRGALMVACAEPLSFSERVAVSGVPQSSALLVWSFADPIHPQYVLDCPGEVLAFQCNPAAPELVVAGCYNGQVMMWDTSAQEERLAHAKQSRKENADPNARSGSSAGASASGAGGEARGEAAVLVVRHSQLSLAEASHHAPVTDLTWLPGLQLGRDGRPVKAADEKAAAECSIFATTAADGKVLFWDMHVGRNRRKVKRDRDDEEVEWRPIHAVPLLSLAGGELAAWKLSFAQRDPAKTTFYVGSFDGELAVADLVKPEGSEQADHTRAAVRAHAGAVVALARSPAADDVLLAVGDWTFGIWREGQHEAPLFCSACAPAQYTAACWSPTRPGVVFLGRADGVVEVWDLLERSHEPSLATPIAAAAVTCLAFPPAPAPADKPAAASSSQQLLAVGDAAGVLHVMDLPRALRRRTPNEAKALATWLKREAARLAYYTQRQPLRAAALKAATDAQKKADEEKEKAAEQAPALPEDADAKAEAAYAKMEAAFREQLGLPPATAVAC